MSCQFFRGLPGFLCMLLRFQFEAWFGILQSSILIMCPSHLHVNCCDIIGWQHGIVVSGICHVT